ncbi:MAG: ABC transporter substrate-binding protein [Gammaproteobacteria bacterium]|nr:MAG: ABC transporter substrate-binding protein [Gammaproteobacteria bacterium]
MVFYLLISLLSISACTQEKDEAIRFGLESAPVTLDPRFSTDAASYRITRLIYRSLVDFDDNFQFIPDLADWEMLAPQHYRFTLGNKGRQFHHGERLIADDVKATYDYVLDINNASPHRGSIAVIKSIDVIDEDTVDFILQHPDPLFPGRLVIGILPAALIDSGHPFNRQPVGSGPMALQEWPNDGDLSLIRLDDKQVLKMITVKDPTVRILKLLRGELDILQGDIPREMIRWLEEQDKTQIEKAQGDTFTYMGFNMADPVTSQLPVRQAIAHAINRDEIIEYVMDNTARKAGAMLPPEHWSGNAELTGVEFDPEESKRLLKVAGYDELKPLQIIYKTSNNPFRVRLATIIQYQLKQVGIEVDVRSYDWGTFYGDIKAGRFQMYSLSWVGLKIPDIFRYAFHSTSLPPNGANRGRFKDATADTMIEAAESKQDLGEQARLYQDLQAYLHEQLPYIPLWYEDNILVTAKDISGYTLASDGNYDGLLTVNRE